MTRKDFFSILIIGGAVGLLIQPILANNLPANDLHYLTLAARVAIFFFFILLAPLALWIAKIISRAAQSMHGIYQFAQFAAVGTLNSFIYGGVLNLETFWYGSTMISDLRYAAFISVSFLCSTTNSFFWNKYWTFSAQGSAESKAKAGQVGGFYGVALVGWVLSVLAATFVKSIGPVDSKLWLNILGPLAGIAAAFIWNFLGYKYWVFKEKK